MAIQLNVSKPGVDQPKIRLNLKKGDEFSIELAWDSDHDVDAHMFLTAGGKLTDAAHILSTYNSQKWGADRTLPINSDSSFSLPSGALHHSGDSLTGVGKAIDELIRVNGAKMPAGIDEIPLVITIHDDSNRGLTFRQVTAASARVLSGAGKELAHVQLTREFSGFTGVHVGTFMLGADGWEFHLVGAGFNGDFNTVLANF